MSISLFCASNLPFSNFFFILIRRGHGSLLVFFNFLTMSRSFFPLFLILHLPRYLSFCLLLFNLFYPPSTSIPLAFSLSPPPPPLSLSLSLFSADVSVFLWFSNVYRNLSFSSVLSLNQYLPAILHRYNVTVISFLASHLFFQYSVLSFPICLCL